jgi:hypothetical protein
MADAMLKAMHEDNVYYWMEPVTDRQHRLDLTPEQQTRSVAENRAPRANIS